MLSGGSSRRAYAAFTVVAGLVAAALVHGCSSTGGSEGAGGGAPCASCVKDADCGPGARCGQFQGDSFCAPDCTDPNSPACGGDRTCSMVNTAEGKQADVCVPKVNVCGGSSSQSAVASTGAGMTCGALDGPTVKSCCTSCMSAGKPCQANGCYGGWWCNKDACGCQQAPAPASCGSSSSSTGAGGGMPGPSGIGPTGGTLDTLTFAVIGDTRPPSEDDVAGYPSAIITKIYQDVAMAGAAFAVSTGDYMFAKPYGNGSADQIALYLKAKSGFPNQLFPAMGNHECTGGTASNCGQFNQSGVTSNYANFLSMMLKGVSTTPYYSVEIDSKSGKWTSKFVFIAANAWDDTQSAWLDKALSKQTTYTFVVRHESSIVSQTPGVNPSDQVVSMHPYTIMLVGHTHTFEWKGYQREMVIGNGGAPLTGAMNYGYVIAKQRADGAIAFTEYDYASNAVNFTVALNPDGSIAQ